MTEEKKEESLIDDRSKHFYEIYLNHYKVLRNNGLDDSLIKEMIKLNFMMPNK